MVSEDEQQYYVYSDILVVYTLALYVPLTIATYKYYFSRVMQLNQKEFHLIMLGLSVCSYTLQILVICLECAYYNLVADYRNKQGDPGPTAIALLRSYNVLLAIYFAQTNLIHLIFTIKYWTLSRRLMQIYSGKEDRYLNIKG